MSGRPVPARAVAGEISTTGAPMKYAHGQHAAYVLDRCRCADCGRANTQYERDRAASMAPAFVDAQPARDHLSWLATQGVGLKTIARESGVAHGTLWKLIYGRNGVPSKRIRPETEQALLAVGLDARAGGAKVPAEVTWKLLDEMIAAGVPRCQIARAIGNGTETALQVSRDLVAMATARKVADVYQQWHAGQIEFVRVDRWGGRKVIVPTTSSTSNVVPIAVKVDMRKIRHRRVVAAGNPHTPTWREPALPETPLRLAAPTEAWRAHARCRDAAPWVFFPTDDDQPAIAKAKKWCNACPVRPQCLEAHLDEPFGIFGGLTAGERRQLQQVSA